MKSNNMNWQRADKAVIINNDMYLVRTNGPDYGDGGLYLRPGFSIASMMTSNVVRGRALWVAHVTEPESA